MITEDQLKSLGFQFEKEYSHDQFYTKRFKSGNLEVELTYEDGKLVSQDLTSEEINCLPISFEDLKVLTPILTRNE